MTEFKNIVQRKINGISSKKNVILCNNVVDFHAKSLDRNIKFDVYYPSYSFSQDIPHALLLMNDAQDMKAVKLMQTLEKFNQTCPPHPVIVVAIHPENNRLREYGTAGIPDYADRGDLAGAYTQFITEELLPWLNEHYPLLDDPKARAFGGFSLGGLSAFDICWQHHHLFNIVGVFSGSLWWRSEPFSEETPDANRIAHRRVSNSVHKKDMRFWFQTGTLDESCDRNNNGVIDSIDDTLDLIAELKLLGYGDGDIRYLEVEGGKHNPKTWRKVLPDFLAWGFGKTASLSE